MVYPSFFSKKVLSSVLMMLVIVPLGFLFIPKTTHAQWVVWDPGNNATAVAGWASMIPNTTANVVNTVKEQGLDAIGYIIAKAILVKMTASTVNWINTGFQGNPSFLTDPERFFGSLGDQVATQYILGANSPLNQLCTPFKAEVRLALVKNHLQENTFQSQCTFATIGANFENFTRDFTQGGWDGWFTMTQQEQNNPYGAYLQAKQQLSVQIGTQQNKYQTQVSNGNGFLSYERCRRDYVPSPNVANRQCIKYEPLTVGGGTPKCLAYETADPDGLGYDDCPASEKEVVTPGSVINEQLGQALGSGFAQLEAADELNEIVNALMVQLVSKTFSSIGNGLRGLSDSKSNQPSLTKQLQDSVNASNQTLGLDTVVNTTDAIAGAVNTIPPEFQPGATSQAPDLPAIQKAIEEETERFRQQYCFQNPANCPSNTGNNENP
jgi:hypothetical protein